MGNHTNCKIGICRINIIIFQLTYKNCKNSQINILTEVRNNSKNKIKKD